MKRFLTLFFVAILSTSCVFIDVDRSSYIDGSAVKISDTNINLDDYVKLSDLDAYIKNPHGATYYLKQEIFTILMGTSQRELQRQYKTYLNDNNLRSLSTSESAYVKQIILFDGTNVVNW